MIKHLLILLLMAAPAWACEGLQAKSAWIREAPPGATVMAGYVTLSNKTSQAQAVCHAESADFGSVEFHKSSMAKGVMSMQAMDALEIPPHANLALAPGGVHLMLFEPRRALKAGDQVHIRFHCGDDAGLDTAFTVKTTP